jgi:hypothetical protein
VSIVLTGGGNFAGDSWTVSTGIVAVINELHYHPFDVDADAEYLEIYNPGASSIDMSNWTFSAGIVGTVPGGTNLPSGGYIVFAKIPSLVQARTGYAGSIAWTSGSLSNGGETIAISDTAGNVIDSVPYSDSGTWPTPPDGDGPSAELINPAMPNQFGGAWRPSVANWGTPGAQNSTFIAAPPPIINDPKHTPLLPLPNQAITVTALVLDDAVTPPTVTLHYRQDFDPTISYKLDPDARRWGPWRRGGRGRRVRRDRAGPSRRRTARLHDSRGRRHERLGGTLRPQHARRGSVPCADLSVQVLECAGDHRSSSLPPDHDAAHAQSSGRP